MECNKDEAIRSRDIAEQKFLLHDLMGAKKFALKAQQLFPGLEGLPQLLAVLNVYIVAQDKVDGVDANWYGILQTHATADDATIRKQYRKLALILHPDKNKAVGAEGAFKLISEAWGVLSDKGKKAAHDARRGHVVRTADGFCNFTNFSTRSWPQRKPVKKTPNFWIACPSCQSQVQCLRAHERDTILCTACHQAFSATEACRTSGDSFCQTGEYSGGKSKAEPIPQEKPNAHHMGGSTSTHSPNKADDSRINGSASISCGSDDHHVGASASSHCGFDEPYGNKRWNARPNEEADANVAGVASQQHSDRLADGMSTSWQYQEGPNMSGSCPKPKNTHPHSNFQFHWGSHRNRTASNHSPAAVEATAEMVQNVYETVKRERVRAQKEARDKAMKERIEAEKEARREELRGRRERKQRRKEEELRKQAKAALHAKIAFDKLFARENKPSVEDTDKCKTDAHEHGILSTNSQVDHSNTNSQADLAD